MSDKSGKSDGSDGVGRVGQVGQVGQVGRVGHPALSSSLQSSLPELLVGDPAVFFEGWGCEVKEFGSFVMGFAGGSLAHH